jgi:hypothetical protein
MKYTVVWIPTADDELATLWMKSKDREVVTSSANEIDRRLRLNPHQQGECRSQGRRILLVPPLGVVYRVNDDDRLVRVLHVWRFQPQE